MKNKLVLISAAILMSFQVLAINNDNAENVENLKAMLFADGAKAGTTVTQQGKSNDGKGCKLTVSFSRYGVLLSLDAGPGARVGFRLSTSAKTSSQMDIQDWDENYVTMSQLALSEDERGTYADKQTLDLRTQERPGEANFNNVSSIEISNLYTTEWTDGTTGRSQPDFSKSKQITVSCSFSARQ